MVVNLARVPLLITPPPPPHPKVTSLVVPRPATFVEATYIQTDFLINATVKWGGWFQAIHSVQDKGNIHAFEQLTKKK